MNVTVNGEAKSLQGDAVTIEGLLDALEIEQRKGVAIAVNLSVVPRSQWGDTRVSDGDEVEIVRATQGG